MNMLITSVLELEMNRRVLFCQDERRSRTVKSSRTLTGQLVGYVPDNDHGTCCNKASYGIVGVVVKFGDK